MPEFETNIVDISEEALDELFNETPDKTPNAKTLVGGTKPPKSTNQEEIEDIDDEELEEEIIEKREPKKKAVPKAKIPPVEEIEDIDIEDLNGEEIDEIDEEEEETEEDEKDKNKKGTKRSEKLDPKKETSQEVNGVLKSTVDYLVEQGIWEDFENREDLEITDEVYAQLVAQQDQRRVEGLFSELVDSTGPFGKAIIDYVKNGGNPDEIIDLFKEQKQVESIKIDSADGQKELIKHYYTEVMGWKPEKADKYISNLMLSNELEPEAQEVKELFGNFYKKEAERLNTEREESVNKQKDIERTFENNIRTTLKSRKDLSLAEQRAVEENLLKYDQRLSNGNMVNKFFVKFAQMQANPADYIDLVLYVMDKQKYVQKVATTEKSKATAEAFKFIKGNGAVSTKKGSGYDQVKKNEKVAGFDWGFNKQ
jgi:hypothetical protein